MLEVNDRCLNDKEQYYYFMILIKSLLHVHSVARVQVQAAMAILSFKCFKTTRFLAGMWLKHCCNNYLKSRGKK